MRKRLMIALFLIALLLLFGCAPPGYTVGEDGQLSPAVGGQNNAANNGISQADNTAVNQRENTAADQGEPMSFGDDQGEPEVHNDSSYNQTIDSGSFYYEDNPCPDAYLSLIEEHYKSQFSDPWSWHGKETNGIVTTQGLLVTIEIHYCARGNTDTEAYHRRDDFLFTVENGKCKIARSFEGTPEPE